MESVSVDALLKHNADQKVLVDRVLNVILHFEERVQCLVEKQDEIMEYIRSKENVFEKISQYEDIISIIRAIPEYTAKAAYLIQEVECLKKRMQYLHESCTQMYHQRQNLLEQWKKIKQKEQEHDATVLRAQYVPDGCNSTQPVIINIKHDASKVMQAHIEEQ
ncbi:hypothetical protein PORY_002493 [Pneumocystis oryctolagi]|uniref:Uncharacterized protein n=1 Tax=Pneumocystis oryctolagi TaxID=42067 RepID=A0ACB7CGJ3_9ASCO|nr:hypothetical protein PORY_002493 [Pneumocystis oryctolagi]